MSSIKLRSIALAVSALAITAGPVWGQSNGFGFRQPSTPIQQGMTGADLGQIIARIDPNARSRGNGYELNFAGKDIIVVFDERAGRMRAMTAVAPADVLSERLMRRLLQSNFDAVLDARYAVSGDAVWAVFIHPLPTLTEVDFTSGLVQVATAAETFGTTFSSSDRVFGGGDSRELNRDLEQSLGPNDDRGI